MWDYLLKLIESFIHIGLVTCFLVETMSEVEVLGLLSEEIPVYKAQKLIQQIVSSFVLCIYYGMSSRR